MEKVTSSDGTTIAFDRVGEGPPVVLVDGAFCARAFGPMPKLAPLLADRFTVIHYDRRARGDSGDEGPYAVEREVEDLDAVIRAAGGSAHVLGASSGGVLALEAAMAGLGIESLAMWEPPFVAVSDSGHRAPENYVERLTRTIAEERRGEAVKFYLTQVMGAPRVMYYAMRVMPWWTKMKAVAPSLPYDAEVMGDFLPPGGGRLASFAVPTLVLGGGKSPAALREAARSATAAIPGARLRMLEGQTHNVSVKALAPALAEFFEARNGSRLGTPSNA
jgi:pimeloyl-ACP methyl ester carboxylesterase